MKLAANIVRLLKNLLFPNHRQELPKDKLGNHGEKKAAKFLKSQGYKIVDKNVRFSIGEIDIVAKTEKTLVVIEVKTRLSSEYCHPLEVVDQKNANAFKKWGGSIIATKNMPPRALRFALTLSPSFGPTGPRASNR